MPSKTEAARLQNDFGADYWVRNTQERRVRTKLPLTQTKNSNSH